MLPYTKGKGRAARAQSLGGVKVFGGVAVDSGGQAGATVVVEKEKVPVLAHQVQEPACSPDTEVPRALAVYGWSLRQRRGFGAKASAALQHPRNLCAAVKSKIRSLEDGKWP